jgi:hypothetical protein
MGLLLLLGGSGTGIVDRYPTVAAAFSLRKIRDNYGGAAIRVRRSSDSAELDVPFISKDLDTSSLLSFVGAGDGFVTTWYDQKSGNNAVNATAGTQPLIVSGGVLQTENSKPAVVFGINKILTTGANVAITRPFTWCVTRRVQADDSEVVTSVAFRMQQIASGNAVRIRVTGGSGASLASAGNTFSIFTGQIQASPNARLRRNGGSWSTSTGYTETPAAAPIILGRTTGAGISNHCESVYFSSELSEAEISAIESNMNAYWGAY